MCFGGTGWAVEMAKLLKKVLYVYDVEKNIWFWYRHDQDLFYAGGEMSEEQSALPTLVLRTAIVGVRNIYDYPNALLEHNETFNRSIPKVTSFCTSSLEQQFQAFHLKMLVLGESCITDLV